MQVFERLLDIIYPRYCCGCKATVELPRGHICWDCRTRLDLISDPMCSLCGDPVEGKVYHGFTCSWCKSMAIHFDQARSALRYRGVAMKMIQEFKYNAILAFGSDLVDILSACVDAHFANRIFDTVVPVPLFSRRQRERSFNQSSILGRKLAARLGVGYNGNCLIRVRDTESQIELNARKRSVNVRNAFGVRSQGRLKGRRILLVDDVMTTGATVNECAKALKAAGAFSVYVVSVARG